jgi:hypothetical protein
MKGKERELTRREWGGDEAHLYNVSSLRTPQRRIAGRLKRKKEKGEHKKREREREGRNNLTQYVS